MTSSHHVQLGFSISAEACKRHTLPFARAQWAASTFDGIARCKDVADARAASNHGVP